VDGLQRLVRRLVEPGDDLVRDGNTLKPPPPDVCSNRCLLEMGEDVVHRLFGSLGTAVKPVANLCRLAPQHFVEGSG
jgi:hypothetical protein